MSNEIIEINEYKEMLSSIKNEILKSQYRAMQVVNVEMIYMYWNIGKIISNNIKWGNKFVLTEIIACCCANSILCFINMNVSL